jgi:hypothetical protein
MIVSCPAILVAGIKSERCFEPGTGLWLAHDKTKHALIMDVEGTDSKERGEKHIVCRPSFLHVSVAIFMQR